MSKPDTSRWGEKLAYHRSQIDELEAGGVDTSGVRSQLRSAQEKLAEYEESEQDAWEGFNEALKRIFEEAGRALDRLGDR